MSDDDVRAGAELARSWLQGKSGLSDDLALLVSGLSQPLDATARAFISMIGNAAKAAPRGKARPTPAGAPAARRRTSRRRSHRQRPRPHRSLI
jgi:hypothetical protein